MNIKIGKAHTFTLKAGELEWIESPKSSDLFVTLVAPTSEVPYESVRSLTLDHQISVHKPLKFKAVVKSIRHLGKSYINRRVQEKYKIEVDATSIEVLS